MTSVVVHGGTNIEPMCCAHVPGLTVFGPYISYQSNDWWGDGFSVIIKRAVHLGIHRSLRVYSVRAQDIWS